MRILEVKFSALPKNTNTPIIQYCRELLEKGEDPNTMLKIYREREDPDVIVNTIGELAKLRVSGDKFKVDTKYLENMPVKAGSSPVH